MGTKRAAAVPTPPVEQSTKAGRLATPVREFIATQNASAIVLLAATPPSSRRTPPWSEGYERLWTTDLAISVAGTPTFFVNGRRHRGAYDIDSLSAAVRREAKQAAAYPSSE